MIHCLAVTGTRRPLGAAAVILLFASTAAHAERPMAVDDAGTLAKGGAKVEFGWSKDDRVRGWDGAAGYGPIDNLELEIGLERVRDRAADPAMRIAAIGFAAKWVPLQAETGLSAGLKLEAGRARLDAPGADRETERARSLTGLATWTFASRLMLHLNLGREWVSAGGTTEAAGTWGLGLDQPLGEDLRFTLEVFGAERSRPNKQAGLRWQVAEGVKLSVAAGTGNGRRFGNAGVAWEF